MVVEFAMTNDNLFERFVVAKTWSADNTHLNMVAMEEKLSSVESPDNLPFSLTSHFKDSFLNLPIENHNFVNRLESMTISEVKQGLEVVPKDASTEVILGILNKNIEDHKRELAMNRGDRKAEIENKLLCKFDHSSLTNFQRFHFSVLIAQYFMAHTGFTLVVKDLFSSHHQNFTTLEDILLMTRLLMENSFWVEDHFKYNDYTILKLHEKIGTINTIQAIKQVALDEEPLTFQNWMDFADRYDELKDTPPSWWVQLL